MCGTGQTNGTCAVCVLDREETGGNRDAQAQQLCRTGGNREGQNSCTGKAAQNKRRCRLAAPYTGHTGWEDKHRWKEEGMK